MANNFTAKDASGTPQTFKSTESGGIHAPHRNIDSVVPGTGATSLGKADDAVHASGDTGVLVLVVRNDAGGALAAPTGDYTPLQVDANGALRTTATSAAPGGYTPYRNLMTTAAVISSNVRASAGRVGYVHGFNVGAAPVFMRLYDKATAAITSDTPVWSGIIPGNTAGAGIALPITDGMVFALGVSVRVTTAIADADATALVANEVMINIGHRT